MIQIKRKLDCCGCTACTNSCPKSAITMVPDEEGFLYPKIDRKRCIECGACEKVCPVLNKRTVISKKQKAILSELKMQKFSMRAPLVVHSQLWLIIFLSRMV